MRLPSEHALHLVRGWYLAARREVVDHLRQVVAQTIEQFFLGDTELRREGADPVRTERRAEIRRGDRAVRAGTDPGLGHLAVAAVVELLEQVAEAAAEHR